MRRELWFDRPAPFKERERERHRSDDVVLPSGLWVCVDALPVVHGRQELIESESKREEGRK